jgi:aspartyl-tRNA(Asn)/glutamyl-tRNA(Gln) amidotransferase subunit C
LNTDDIEPLIFLTNEVNQLRKDTNNQEISKSEALKNAPKKDSDYFRIAKVKGKVNP